MSIILGLPKGSLQDSTFALFKRAGFNVSCSSRSYIPSIDDDEIKCRLLRPQEMSRYVELGLLDAGICGYDWVYENGSGSMIGTTNGFNFMGTCRIIMNDYKRRNNNGKTKDTKPIRVGTEATHEAEDGSGLRPVVGSADQSDRSEHDHD